MSSPPKLSKSSYIEKLRQKSKHNAANNKGVNKLFQSFFVDKWKQLQNDQLRNEFEDEDITYEDHLVRELKKEPIDKLSVFSSKKKPEANLGRRNQLLGGNNKKLRLKLAAAIEEKGDNDVRNVKVNKI